MIRIFALNDAYRACCDYVQQSYIKTYSMYGHIMREPSSFFVSEHFKTLVLYMCQRDLEVVGFIDEFSKEYALSDYQGEVVTDHHFIGDVAVLASKYDDLNAVDLDKTLVTNDISIVSVRSEGFHAQFTSPTAQVAHILYTKDIADECVGYFHEDLSLKYSFIEHTKAGLLLSLWRFIVKGYGIDFMCLHSEARPVLYCVKDEIEYMLSKLFTHDACFYLYTVTNDLEMIDAEPIKTMFLELAKASYQGDILPSQHMNISFSPEYEYERLIYTIGKEILSFDVLSKIAKKGVSSV